MIIEIIMVQNNKKNIIDLTYDPHWFDKNTLKIWGKKETILFII